MQWKVKHTASEPRPRRTVATLLTDGGRKACLLMNEAVQREAAESHVGRSGTPPLLFASACVHNCNTCARFVFAVLSIPPPLSLQHVPRGQMCAASARMRVTHVKGHTCGYNRVACTGARHPHHLGCAALLPAQSPLSLSGLRHLQHKQIETAVRVHLA